VLSHDREIRHSPRTVREAQPEPAGDAAGEGRDDQLVESVGPQGVADGGEGVGSPMIAASTSRPAILIRRAPTSARGVGSGAAGLNVGSPSQTTWNGGNEEGKAGRGAGGRLGPGLRLGPPDRRGPRRRRR
jgi:hypothetical protein